MFMYNSQFDISGHLLPTVFRSHAWGILHTLLEMFSYRLHHFQPHYRVQLLNHLHSLAAVTQTNQTQLHLWQVFIYLLIYLFCKIYFLHKVNRIYLILIYNL